MQAPTLDRTNLTPIEGARPTVRVKADVTPTGESDLGDLRDNIAGAMAVLNRVMKRTRTGESNVNPNYSNETGRAAAVALTKLEEALMWAERAYLWEGK